MPEAAARISPNTVCKALSTANIPDHYSADVTGLILFHALCSRSTKEDLHRDLGGGLGRAWRCDMVGAFPSCMQAQEPASDSANGRNRMLVRSEPRAGAALFRQATRLASSAAPARPEEGALSTTGPPCRWPRRGTRSAVRALH